MSTIYDDTSSDFTAWLHLTDVYNCNGIELCPCSDSARCSLPSASPPYRVRRRTVYNVFLRNVALNVTDPRPDLQRPATRQTSLRRTLSKQSSLVVGDTVFVYQRRTVWSTEQSIVQRPHRPRCTGSGCTCLSYVARGPKTVHELNETSAHHT
jgi:hypothetical protein